MREKSWAVTVVLMLLAAAAIQAACAEELPLDRIKLPPGFQIEIYAVVPNARSLALGDNDTVFVGTQR